MDERRREISDHATGGSEEDLSEDERTDVYAMEQKAVTRKRHIMLACACLLGLGSHFGAYLLGPLKGSLKTSENGFASLIASFELLNTVTPLVCGFLVPRFGAANVGLVATGCVLIGQFVVFLSQGDDMNIFAAFYSSVAASLPSVGRSVALGLVLGKTSSFLAGASSDWLHSFSPRMPFAAATCFAGVSFAASIVYARTERSLRTLPSSISAPHAAHKSRAIDLASYTNFGDPFWLYIAICFLAGSWYTTIHLSTNLLQAVYDIGQRSASEAASILLLSPTFLYPLVGWLLDKQPDLMAALYMSAPIGLASSLSGLIFFSAVVPYQIVLGGAALTCGIGPLLSVLVVPRIVNADRAPAALALHKSLEMSGGIIFQTISGFLLSASTTTSTSSDTDGTARHEDPDSTLFFLLVAALVQLGFVSGFWGLMRRRGLDPPSSVNSDDKQLRGRSREVNVRLRVSTERLRRTSSSEETEYGLLRETSRDRRDTEEEEVRPSEDESDSGEEGSLVDELSIEERARGKKCLVAACSAIASSWLAFVLNLLL
ncbi:uncharacterized protein JCM6883_005536 [Sporobolomyces salmoneus]|uniref:uncharacterized protein n=1 Tax=Sporobolomyces salmoneus TaxID=183962 RepID=UPI003175D7EF